MNQKYTITKVACQEVDSLIGKELQAALKDSSDRLTQAIYKLRQAADNHIKDKIEYALSGLGLNWWDVSMPQRITKATFEDKPNYYEWYLDFNSNKKLLLWHREKITDTGLELQFGA